MVAGMRAPVAAPAVVRGAPVPPPVWKGA
jgi:hypothetical protein